MRTMIVSQDRTTPVVSLESAMEHSRITDSYDELVVSEMVDSATNLVEMWTNRKLFPTKLVSSIPSLEIHKSILLPYSPKSVERVMIENTTDGSLHESDYYFSEFNQELFVRNLSPASNINVVVYYDAGYKCDEIPEGLRHAVKVTFATLYENREDTVIGASVSEVPTKAKNLIKAYRIKAVR